MATMIDRYYALLDENDGDGEAWQAARAVSPPVAYSALRAAVSQVLNEAIRPDEILTGILWQLAYGPAGDGDNG